MKKGITSTESHSYFAFVHTTSSLFLRSMSDVTLPRVPHPLRPKKSFSTIERSKGRKGWESLPPAPQKILAWKDAATLKLLLLHLGPDYVFIISAINE